MSETNPSPFPFVLTEARNLVLGDIIWHLGCTLEVIGVSLSPMGSRCTIRFYSPIPISDLPHA